MVKLCDSVVAFDLDDTLYKERDYVVSGLKAVLCFCKELGLVKQALSEDVLPDPGGGLPLIRALRTKLGLPEHLEQSLLWVYRLHLPSIRMTAEDLKAFQEIAHAVGAVAIITNGRSATQRLKLRALGLSNVEAFISEDYGAEKPAHSLFKAVESRWPGRHYIYIGDNLAKDFVGPNKLGWLTLGVRDDGRNIHPQVSADWARSFHPQLWTNNLSEALKVIIAASKVE